MIARLYLTGLWIERHPIVAVVLVIIAMAVIPGLEECQYCDQIDRYK